MVQVRSYSVEVEEVHSGDDIVVMVDLGVDKLFKRVRCRLTGVDTPSAYKAKVDSMAGTLREEIKALISAGKSRVEVVAEGKGGWLVTLFVKSTKTQEEVNVNEMLKDRGFVYRGKIDGAIKPENS